MNIFDMFTDFLSNIAIDNTDQFSGRHEEITCCLNKKYRKTESKTANSLWVGSYGRSTAIKDISDLDMIYMLPKSEWDRFKEGRQSALLQEIKNTIKARYSNTDIRGDGQVVIVSFENQDFEVVPAFEQFDGSFKYPNTNDGGSWPIANPRAEIKAIVDMDSKKNGNLRKLCKMIRAWKNKHAVIMGGLLIDTLAYNFSKSTSDYNDKSYMYYGYMVRDFFKFISELCEQDYYIAPGSGQYVYSKKKFQTKAKKAYELCIAAIEANGQSEEAKKWKKVFGRPFPDGDSLEKAKIVEMHSWNNTEEFIEDMYPVDIRYNLEINCDVLQDGFREHTLLHMLKNMIPLMPKKKLTFKIINNDVPMPYEIKWKVLNRGEIAKKRNEIRGQIIPGTTTKKERTTFRGNHLVESYIVKNGVVVAKDRIDVPIKAGE